MKHVRKQLRDAARHELTEALIGKKCAVVRARGYARIPERMPLIEISTPSEDVEGVTQDELMQRIVTLQLTIMVAAEGPAEDEADGWAVYAEKAMSRLADNALVKDMTSLGMSFEVAGEGDSRVGRMILTYSAEIHTAENDPTQHI